MYEKGPHDKLLISAQVLNFQLILLHDYSLKNEGMKTKHLLTPKVLFWVLVMGTTTHQSSPLTSQTALPHPRFHISVCVP